MSMHSIVEESEIYHPVAGRGYIWTAQSVISQSKREPYADGGATRRDWKGCWGSASGRRGYHSISAASDKTDGKLSGHSVAATSWKVDAPAGWSPGQLRAMIWHGGGQGRINCYAGLPRCFVCRDSFANPSRILNELPNGGKATPWVGHPGRHDRHHIQRRGRHFV